MKCPNCKDPFPPPDRTKRACYVVRRALSNATDVLKKAKTEVATLQGFGDGFDPKLQEYTRELGHILAAIDKLQSET